MNAVRRGGLLLVPAFLISGCRSASIATTVRNQTGGAISEMEVDYPSASFGSNGLPAGETYPYRFEIIGSGALKVTWTDAAQHVHTSSGPSLHEREGGTLAITLERDGTAHWDLNAH